MKEMAEQKRQSRNDGGLVVIFKAEQIRQSRNDGRPVAISETEQIQQSCNDGRPVAISQVRQACNTEPVAFSKKLYFRLLFLCKFDTCIFFYT